MLEAVEGEEKIGGMMLALIVMAIFFVMLAVIWFNEDWKKALKIIGFFFLWFCLGGLILIFLGVKKHSPGSYIFSAVSWCVWTIGLIFYNIKNGYISKF